METTRGPTPLGAEPRDDDMSFSLSVGESVWTRDLILGTMRSTEVRVAKKKATPKKATAQSPTPQTAGVPLANALSRAQSVCTGKVTAWDTWATGWISGVRDRAATMAAMTATQAWSVGTDLSDQEVVNDIWRRDLMQSAVLSALATLDGFQAVATRALKLATKALDLFGA